MRKRNRRISFNSFAGSGSVITALQFDGVNGKVSGFSVATAASWSMSFWIQPIASSDTYASILNQGITIGLYYRGDTRKLSLYSGGDQLSTTALTEGVWSHVTLSVNGGTGTYYINGVSAGTFNGGQPVFDTMGDDANSETFKGILSDLCVYSIALSGAQAANLANKSTTPAAIGSRLAHWLLNDVANGVSGNGATFADSSGNGKTGTGSGGLVGKTTLF